jgi:hypothetical protein
MRALLELLQMGALYLAPAALLVLLFVCGRYPGSRAIERVIGRRRPARRRAPERLAHALVPHDVLCGGRLVVAALALRGPPSRWL